MNIALLAALLAALLLIISTLLLLRCWRSNLRSPKVQDLGLALFISPAVFAPQVYDKALQKKVIVCDLLILFSIASLATSAHFI